MRKIKLLIEYDGTQYHGWQVQPHAPTLQEVIQEKIMVMTRHPVHLLASGRTDAGVHALGQVACFMTPTRIPVSGFRHGLNSLLPRDIRIRSAEETDPAFHPQYAAKRKTYLYRILNSEAPSAVYRNFSWHIPLSLDVPAMQEAAGTLIGAHDFSSFQGADADGMTTVREVFRAEWRGDKGKFLSFTIAANGFLKHMVRNIVGTLVDVGKGRTSGDEFRRILTARDRRLAGPTAPPQGLFLLEVTY
jgi:tRNA pseudouridine38-40 synthase